MVDTGTRNIDNTSDAARPSETLWWRRNNRIGPTSKTFNANALKSSGMTSIQHAERQLIVFLGKSKFNVGAVLSSSPISFSFRCVTIIRFFILFYILRALPAMHQYGNDVDACCRREKRSWSGWGHSTRQYIIALGPALNQLSLMMPSAYSSIETSNRIHPSSSSLFVKKINLFAFSNRSQCNKERPAAHFIHYIRRRVVNHNRGKRFG